MGFLQIMGQKKMANWDEQMMVGADESNGWGR